MFAGGTSSFRGLFTIVKKVQKKNVISISLALLWPVASLEAFILYLLYFCICGHIFQYRWKICPYVCPLQKRLDTFLTQCFMGRSKANSIFVWKNLRIFMHAWVLRKLSIWEIIRRLGYHRHHQTVFCSLPRLFSRNIVTP